MTAAITPDTRVWPTATGEIYAADQGTYTMLAIAGHDHGPSINIHPALARPGQYRLTLYTTRVHHTHVAGHPDVIRSVAETMLRGARPPSRNRDQTMTRKLQVYSHIDSGNTMLPRDVLEALGESTWVRQGHLYVWATTAKAAAQRLTELGLGHDSPRTLRVCEHFSIIDALTAAHNWPEGTVLAARLSGGGPVVEITENPDRSVLETPRALRCVGELRSDVVFRPADCLTPVVTDAMVEAALASHTCACTDMRTAIAAALRAQRNES